MTTKDVLFYLPMMVVTGGVYVALKEMAVEPHLLRVVVAMLTGAAVGAAVQYLATRSKQRGA